MTRVLSTVTVLLFLALPAAALAKPKVALAPLDGDKTGDVIDGVSEALDAGEVTVVGPSKTSKAIDKLGLDLADLSDRDLKKLASELEADAIVWAKLTSKGGNKVLHFKLYAHGKKQKGFKVEFASASSSKFKQMLHDKMLEKLGVEKMKKKGGDDDEAPAGDDDQAEKSEKPDKSAKAEKAAAKAGKAKKGKKKGGDDDEASGDDDKPEKPEKPVKMTKAQKAEKEKAEKAEKMEREKAEKAEKAEKSKKKGGDDDEAPAGDDDEKGSKKKGGDDDTARGDDEGAPKKGKRTAHAGDEDGGEELHGSTEDHATAAVVRPANRVAARVDLGMSFTGRSLTFNSRPNLDNPPRGYKNSPVPGARVEGAVYPLALMNPDSITAGIGLGFLYDKTMGLSLKNSMLAGETFPADASRYDIGPRFRYVFGSAATSPSLAVGVDYGHRTFKITGGPDRAMIDIPDVDYRGWTPNVELRVPIMSAVTLIFGGGVMLLQGAGPVQSNSQYGRAKVTEGEGRVGVDMTFKGHYAVRLMGEFAQVGFQFTGTGQLAINRDMNPATPDVGGASDRYLGGAATFSVLY